MFLFRSLCISIIALTFGNNSFSQKAWYINVVANRDEDVFVSVNNIFKQKVEKGKKKDILVFGEQVTVLLTDRCRHSYRKVIKKGETVILIFPPFKCSKIPEPDVLIGIENNLNKILKKTSAEASRLGEEVPDSSRNVDMGLKLVCNAIEEGWNSYKKIAEGYKKTAYQKGEKNRADNFLSQQGAAVKTITNIIDRCSPNEPPDCLKTRIDVTNVNSKMDDGSLPVFYAIQNCDTSIVRSLVDMGAVLDYFGERFEKNKVIYKTPLAVASIRGDTNLIKILIDAQAAIYPPITYEKEKREHARFLKQSCTPDVIAILVRNGYDMEDGSSSVRDISNSMLLIEGGTFTFGCLVEQGGDCPSDALPRIPSMAVSSFYLSKFEVTQEQWEAVMDENPSYFNSCRRCPVEMVTWNDVQIFLKKLNEMTGKKYRLPTEVEWEFAAKGGTNENRYVFSGSNNIDSVAWYGNNSEGKTHEAGSKAPNALGLYDMSGNVYEWCNSSYTEDLTHYLNTPSAVASGGDKVLKGGSWRHTKRQAKVSFRWYNGSDIKSEWYGFRLALDKE